MYSSLWKDYLSTKGKEISTAFIQSSYTTSFSRKISNILSEEMLLQKC